jgi:hypothetical protein
MISNKFKVLSKYTGSAKLNESNQRKRVKIGVIFSVALAIAKFQRFESKKFRRSIKKPH